MPVHAAIRIEFDRLRRQLYWCIAVLAIIVAVVGWFGDYRSCQRQHPIRQALRDEAVVHRQAETYWRERGEAAIAARAAARAEVGERVTGLDCLRLFPES